MTDDDGRIVRLSSDNWIRIFIFIAGHTICAISAAVAIWVRVAVVETEISHLKQETVYLKEQITKLGNRLQLPELSAIESEFLPSLPPRHRSLTPPHAAGVLEGVRGYKTTKE